MIKFRVYDVENNKYVTEDRQWRIKPDGELVYESVFGVEYGADEFIPEFSVGKKDMDGKEIFEGDVVDASWGFRGEVEMEDFYFYARECRISDDMKIVGNIHEVRK